MHTDAGVPLVERGSVSRSTGWQADVCPQSIARPRTELLGFAALRSISVLICVHPWL